MKLGWAEDGKGELNARKSVTIHISENGPRVVQVSRPSAKDFCKDAIETAPLRIPNRCWATQKHPL